MYKLDTSNFNEIDKYITVTDKRDKVIKYNLSDNVVETILSWLKYRNRLAVDFTDPSALFVSNRGNRLSTDAISDIVTKYATDITGKHITPHKLRATFGTQIYAATKDIYLTQQCMQHSSAAITQLYIRGQQNENRQRGSDIMGRLTDI